LRDRKGAQHYRLCLYRRKRVVITLQTDLVDETLHRDRRVVLSKQMDRLGEGR
jgi:hypothetical protein